MDLHEIYEETHRLLPAMRAWLVDERGQWWMADEETFGDADVLLLVDVRYPDDATRMAGGCFPSTGGVAAFIEHHRTGPVQAEHYAA